MKRNRSWRTGPHSCSWCGTPFRSTAGVRIHVGLVHHAMSADEIRRADAARSVRRRLGTLPRPRRVLGRAAPDVPAPYTGHPLFEQARGMVEVTRAGNHVQYWHETLQQDLMGEAVLALVEGADPREAVRRYFNREYDWQRHTAPLEWVA